MEREKVLKMKCVNPEYTTMIDGPINNQCSESPSWINQYDFCIQMGAQETV